MRPAAIMGALVVAAALRAAASALDALADRAMARLEREYEQTREAEPEQTTWDTEEVSA